MDTQEINEILGENVVTRDRFHGVFARDTLPELSDGGSYAVNTDIEAESGSHWCAIWRNAETETETLECEVEFWDSLGRAPKEYEFRFSLAGHTPFRLVYQDSRIQAPLSQFCGEHVCHFIFWRSSGASMTEIAASFSKDAKNNDRIVQNFRESLLEKQMKMEYYH
jgi:hypothetical protein